MELGVISLDEKLVRAIKEIGYKEFTPIQLAAIPEVQKGRDVIAQSSTGSGKTAAFGLPILEKIHAGKGIQVIVLTPTRELCAQVASAMQGFAKHTRVKVAAIYGGVSINPQIDALKSADIVVGTPGRVLDHMGQGTLRLGSVKFFVLDEADRMCDMGFYDDMEKIIRVAPRERQTLLFSATYTRDVNKLVASHMKSPVSVQAEQYVDPSLLQQVYYDVSDAEKFAVMVNLLKKNTFGMSMVFCATRREVDRLERNFKKQGLHAMAIHGGLTQAKRLRAIELLKKEHIDLLVATDVAARGLDIGNVSYIYNWDVPPTPDEYIHRIGRTARAGKNGLAITLLAPRDHINFRTVLRNSSLNIRKEPTPEVEIIELRRSFGPTGGDRTFRRGRRDSAGDFGRGRRQHHLSNKPHFGGVPATGRVRSSRVEGLSSNLEGTSHSMGFGQGRGGRGFGHGNGKAGLRKNGFYGNSHRKHGPNRDWNSRQRQHNSVGFEGLSHSDYRDIGGGSTYNRRKRGNWS